jgi:hypothetical protein
VRGPSVGPGVAALLMAILGADSEVAVVPGEGVRHLDQSDCPNVGEHYAFTYVNQKLCVFLSFFSLLVLAWCSRQCSLFTVPPQCRCLMPSDHGSTVPVFSTLYLYLYYPFL